MNESDFKALSKGNNNDVPDALSKEIEILNEKNIEPNNNNKISNEDIANEFNLLWKK